MIKRNAKAWIAALTAPTIAIVLTTFDKLFGLSIPGLEGVVSYLVVAALTYAATWITPNA